MDVDENPKPPIFNEMEFDGMLPSSADEEQLLRKQRRQELAQANQ